MLFLVGGGGALGGRPVLEFGPPGGKREPEPETGVRAPRQMADGELARPPSGCLLEEQGMGMGDRVGGVAVSFFRFLRGHSEL